MANKPVRPGMVDKLMKQYKKGTKGAKRSKPKKTAHQKKVGTTSGATQLSWAVAQSTDDVLLPNSSIQIDRHLNLVNRRLYRQNMVYTAKIELSNPNEDQQPIGIYVLRNSWAVRKALQTAKTVYDQAVSEERAQVGNARWHDFRIVTQGSNMWNQSRATFPFCMNGPAAEYRPITEGLVGEYDYSSVAATDANGNEIIRSFGLQDLTVAGGSYSVWEEFQNMGPKTMSNPVTSSPGGYDRARGTSFEDANVVDLLDEGNLPPYDANNLNLDTAWVKVGEVGRLSTGGMITSTGYFEAPLGVIVLHGYAQRAAAGAALPERTQLIEVCVKEGDYKGVAAQPI